MANASPRRSFHGPFHTPRPLPRRPRDPAPSGPLELLSTPPGASSLGRVVLNAARDEAPTSSERDRVLANVLSALQRLTSANR
jgi:hypothetical protein